MAFSPAPKAPQTSVPISDWLSGHSGSLKSSQNVVSTTDTSTNEGVLHFGGIVIVTLSLHIPSYATASTPEGFTSPSPVTTAISNPEIFHAIVFMLYPQF